MLQWLQYCVATVSIRFVTAGFAPTFDVLIIGRMIQAMGAGVFGPLMNVVVMNLFSPNERGSAMGTIGLALNFAPALGPSLSGLVVTNLSWRFLFYRRCFVKYWSWIITLRIF